MNFGEELAYWYLRLNGFFPLTNFVYHKSDSAEFSGDCDVLAYRPAGVWEEIGGQEVDWDPRLRGMVDFERPAVVICEVKTGAFDPRWLFPPDRLRYAFRRAGLPEPGDPQTTGWTKRPSFDHGSCTSYNLLIAREARERARWHTIRIEECVEFLRDRFVKYPEKFRDRAYFHSALVQFLAFESEVARASERSP